MFAAWLRRDQFDGINFDGSVSRRCRYCFSCRGIFGRKGGGRDVHGFVFFAFFKIPFEKEEAESCFELIFYAKEFEIFGPDLSITLFYSC